MKIEKTSEPTISMSQHMKNEISERIVDGFVNAGMNRYYSNRFEHDDFSESYEMMEIIISSQYQMVNLYDVLEYRDGWSKFINDDGAKFFTLIQHEIIIQFLSKTLDDVIFDDLSRFFENMAYLFILRESVTVRERMDKE